jgi:hypothetical protein
MLTDAQKADALKKIDDEIADAFQFAKSSAFPGATDWAEMNRRPDSPLADKLLSDIEVHAFDENQTVVQAKGY